MPPRHCTDEELLAHADGELSRRRESKVGEHLERCWQCRSRLAELEEQIRSLARAFEDQSFPSPGRIEGARRRFQASVRRHERSLVLAPAVTVLPGYAGRAVRAAAIPLLVLAAAAGLLWWVSGRKLTPGDVLAAASGVERSIRQSAPAVHQEFRVEVQQTRPRGPRHSTRLEVWSETRSGRFATRWSDDGGVVRYAAWRPAPDREYVYVPGSGVEANSRAGSARTVSLAALADFGLGAEEIERAFLRWLQGREWTPIWFTPDFQAFCGGEGVVMSIERLPAVSGPPSLRLRAQRRSGLRRVEIVMEVDAHTFRPRLQTIRFEDASRSVELRLVAHRNEMSSGNHLAPAIFEPDPGLIRPRSAANRDHMAPGPAPPALEPQLPVTALSDAELDELEIGVRYSLHRLRACLGEPLEIERLAGRGLRVSGVVETTSRRAQLLAALDELRNPASIIADIRTTEEYLREQKNPPPAGRVTRIGPSRLPIQDQLERYVEERQEAPARMAQLANDAIDVSKTMLAEAWALRRLGERYEGESFLRLRPRSRWLVEVMLRDHLEAFRGGARRGHAELGPFLASISGSARRKAVLTMPPAGPSSLLEGVMALFRKAEEADLLTRGLFAGAGLPAPAEEAAARLLAAFEQVEEGFERVAGLMNEEFSGNPELQSRGTGPGDKGKP